MPPRLGYRKSRKGCQRCKERRVKCDEKSPCEACIRHGVPCSLLSSELQGEMVASSPKDHSITPHSKNLDLPNNQVVQPSPQGPASMPTTVRIPETLPLCFPGEPYPDLATPCTKQWSFDLALVHHYTARTWMTLPNGYRRQQVWQLEVPTLAFAHDFLMHQLLAISAYHLAYLQPDGPQRYLIQASHHQDIAIKGLHCLLPRVDSSNCHAVFVTATFLALGAFASGITLLSQHSPPSLNALLDVFLLVRGMHSILQDHNTEIARGPIGTMLLLESHDSATPFLRTMVEELTRMSFALPDDVTPTVRGPCLDAITSLIDSIRHAGASSRSPENRVSLTWPFAVSDHYITLLRQRNIWALRVLVPYGRILKSAETENWYLESWGSLLLEDLEAIMHRTEQ